MSEYISSSSSSRSFYTSFRWRWTKRLSRLPRQGRRWLCSPLDRWHRILLPRRRCISPAKITVNYWKLQKYPNVSANMRRLPWSSSWLKFFSPSRLPTWSHWSPQPPRPPPGHKVGRLLSLLSCALSYYSLEIFCRFVRSLVHWKRKKTPIDNIRPINTNSAINRSAPVTMVDVAKVEVIMVREFVLTVHSAVSKLGDGL